MEKSKLFGILYILLGAGLVSGAIYFMPEWIESDGLVFSWAMLLLAITFFGGAIFHYYKSNK